MIQVPSNLVGHFPPACRSGVRKILQMHSSSERLEVSFPLLFFLPFRCPQELPLEMEHGPSQEADSDTFDSLSVEIPGFE